MLGPAQDLTYRSKPRDRSAPAWTQCAGAGASSEPGAVSSAGTGGACSSASCSSSNCLACSCSTNKQRGRPRPGDLLLLLLDLSVSVQDCWEDALLWIGNGFRACRQAGRQADFRCELHADQALAAGSAACGLTHQATIMGVPAAKRNQPSHATYAYAAPCQRLSAGCMNTATRSGARHAALFATRIALVRRPPRASLTGHALQLSNSRRNAADTSSAAQILRRQDHPHAPRSRRRCRRTRRSRRTR